MNNIENKKDYETSYKVNNKKEISIPLIPLLIILIVISIFIFKICLTNSKVIASTDDNISNESNTTENKLNNTEEILIGLQDEVNDNSTNEESNVVEETNTTNNIPQSNTPKVTTYTASDGKKYDIVGRLEIPSLGIKYPILSSTSDALLKVSLNKYWGANPNEIGNMVVVGHNYKNGKFFSKLPNIEEGAIINITDLDGRTLEYKVYETNVIDPYDNSCTSQLTNGKIEVTLITCFYENGNIHATKRFVAKARAN